MIKQTGKVSVLSGRAVNKLVGPVNKLAAPRAFEEKELSCPTQSVLWQLRETLHTWGRVYRGSVRVRRFFLGLLGCGAFPFTLTSGSKIPYFPGKC